MFLPSIPLILFPFVQSPASKNLSNCGSTPMTTLIKLVGFFQLYKRCSSPILQQYFTPYKLFSIFQKNSSWHKESKGLCKWFFFYRTKFMSVDAIARHSSSLWNKVLIQERGLDVSLIWHIGIQAWIKEKHWKKLYAQPKVAIISVAR